MSEEEIIKVITYKLNMKNADVYAPILYEEIQNLLDLYNKEKSKNEKVKKYIKEKHKQQYKYSLSKIECEDIMELLEE